MWKLLCITGAVILLILCLPLLFGGEPAVGDPLPGEATPLAQSLSAGEPAGAGQRDIDWRMTVSTGGQLRETSLADYLPGVIAGEMPASFQTEALKAQAVAARTYILYKQAHATAAHPEAVVCDDPGCCKAYLDETALRERWGENYTLYWDRVCTAAAETDGLILTYGGEAIQAVFHASSAGKTESSGAIWGQLPYLVSVSSPEAPETVENLVSTVEVAPDSFRETILSLNGDAQLTGDPGSWAGAVEYTEGERVAFWNIGGVNLDGGSLRTAFGLRSTSFTLEYTGSAFVFTVSGYGHGVGMSQYGADLMAEEGSDCAEILAHYYPGTVLETIRVSG